MKPNEVLPQFDDYLHKKGLNFEAIVIGASALVAMNVITRETVDVDCLDPKIPTEILMAAAEFKKLNPKFMLIEKWINNGPESLIRELTIGWRERTVLIFKGKSLCFYTLGRIDLLKTKLFAYCDRGDDFHDCIALKPSLQELEDCFLWVSERDANEMWPKHVEAQFLRLKKALGYV